MFFSPQWSCLISPKVAIEPGSPENPYEHDTPAASVGLWSHKIHVLTVQVYSQHPFVSHVGLSEIISTAQQERTLLATQPAHIQPRTHTSNISFFQRWASLTPSTTRDEAFHHAPMVCENEVQWCHEEKHIHTAHTRHTSLFHSQETQTLKLCFCLWPAYKAWYNDSAWLIFHQTFWYYHSVIHYRMLFGQSSTQTGIQILFGAVVILRAMLGHFGFHWSD